MIVSVVSGESGFLFSEVSCCLLLPKLLRFCLSVSFNREFIERPVFSNDDLRFSTAQFRLLSF